MSINIDKNNIKWIGTEFGGLVKFDDSTWTTYTSYNSDLPSDIILSIAVDSLNNKWIGTKFGGLAKFDDFN